MRNCLRIPRIYLPRKGFKKWAVIACDQFTSDRAYWKRVARTVGDAPSALSFILPEVYLGESDEERIEEIHESMYAALENDWMRKLDRGCVLVKRTTKTGTRRGILICVDLEEYSAENGDKTALVRATEEVVPSRLPPRVALRRGAVLEFPHAMLFYRDKKDKLMRALEGEDLEKLYGFDLMEHGGSVEGYFIPEYLAADVARELMGKADPCFAVADGNHTIAAAKAYWEEIKPKLSAAEQRNHPARFTLVEFVNVFDEAIVFHPIHRLVKEVEKDAFCDYFSGEIKCTRKGDLLYPALPAEGESVAKIDSVIARYLKANGGNTDYIHGEQALAQFSHEEGNVGIVLKCIAKDDVFSVLKSGKKFPKKTFSVGEETEKRYYLEGREISYD